MTDVNPNELKTAIERMHSCTAKLLHSVWVSDKFEGNPVWEGIVQVFDLDGHPTAKRAYAWSSPIEGSTKRKFFAVLHAPPIRSALDAVRAAIVKEHRTKRRA